jgi:hypothetical protein
VAVLLVCADDADAIGTDHTGHTLIATGTRLAARQFADVPIATVRQLQDQMTVAAVRPDHADAIRPRRTFSAGGAYQSAFAAWQLADIDAPAVRQLDQQMTTLLERAADADAGWTLLADHHRDIDAV